MSVRPISFQAYGPARLRSVDGEDVTPKSVKAVALVALLLDEGDGKHGRRWVESLLWPDKTPDRASGSLRQTLHLLRQALGDAYIHSDRNSLSVKHINLDARANASAQSKGQLYLEGLDIDSPPFNDWLSLRRSRMSPQLPMQQSTTPFDLPESGAGILEPVLVPAQASTLVLRTNGSFAEGGGGFIGSALADHIGDLLKEFGEHHIYHVPTQYFDTVRADQLQVTLPQNGLELAIDVRDDGSFHHLRFSLRTPLTGRVFWTHHRRITHNILMTSSEFQELIFRTVEATYRALTQMPRDQAAAEGAAALGLKHLFKFDSNGHACAEQMLEQAIALDDRPIYHAWKAMLHQMQAVERTRSDWGTEVDKARLHMSRAEQVEQPSSMICALLAQCHVMLNHDVELGSLYAQRAYELNPGNAFAYSALACSELRRGEFEDAYEAANTGARLAAATSYAPWWHLLAGLSAMAMEAFGDAMFHYRKASMHAPNFRAPLRNLYVLLHTTGLPEEAERYRLRLLEQEPDFSLYRLKTDMDYPASTIRASSLMALL